MSVVVDSSVVVAALVDTGSDGLWSEKMLEGRALYAPVLMQVEATNILRRLEQTRKVSSAEANAAREDLMQMQVELLPFEPFSDRIWAMRHTVTSYDAWYVAIAEAIGFPLVTLDGRLANASGPKCEFLTPVAN